VYDNDNDNDCDLSHGSTPSNGTIIIYYYAKMQHIKIQ